MTASTSIVRYVALAVIALLNFVISTTAAQIIKKYVSRVYDSTASKFGNVSRMVITLTFVFLANALVRKIMTRLGSGHFAGVNLASIAERNGTPATGFAYVMFLGNDLKTFMPLITIA